MIRGNCLNLLNLDTDVDEEKYRKAMERPISPDLPIIRPRRTKAPAYKEPHNLGDETLNDCPASGSDAIDFKMKLSQLDRSSNRIGCSDSVKQLSANDKSNAAGMPTNAYLGCLLHEDEARNSVASSAKKSDNNCSGLPSSVLYSQHLCQEAPEKNSSHQICNGSSDPGLEAIVGKSKTEVTKPINLDSNNMLGHHCFSEKTPMYLVVFTRMKRSNIVNIFRYSETLISKEASIDGPLLERVSAEPLLPTVEKVSLILSLLLSDIRLPAEPFTDGNFAASAFSLSVKSCMETRWTFLKRDQLDTLVSLIEDFLVNKEVVVCKKMGQKVSDGKYHNLDGESGLQLSTKPATIDQFISACILLASICVEVDRVDVVLEVSYEVLQIGKSNLYWTLLALHVFGSVCGDKLLLPKSCNFVMRAICLVVLLLESKDTSICLVSSYIQRNRPTTLPSCAHCLFDVDMVSIDDFISSLLDELDLCSRLWNNPENSKETIGRCSSHLGSSGLEINCGEACTIFKQGKLAEDNHNYPAGIDLCYFTELISLLELFGIYMNCEWTYNNVVVRLLEILESCVCEEYSAAVLVLVSRLGRFFIEDVGYEQRAVSELRNKLSLLLGTSFTNSRSVTVQFSSIGALLSLLPLPFDKIVGTQSRPLSGPFDLQTSQISEWFVQLSKEHQSLALSFFS
uniref:Uncharacterized protein n=1 Tax=Arundo donax TaxID=35708 RepID=A0A0A8Z7R2_ARUDO